MKGATYLDRLRENVAVETALANRWRQRLAEVQATYDLAEANRLKAVDALTDYITERRETDR